MAVTSTGRLYKPTVSGDAGVWAPAINSNYDYIDEMINSLISVAIPDTNISLVADGTSNDQARYSGYNFTGALTANRTITLPANEKFVWVLNSTTGGKSLILSAGGTTITIANTGVYHFIYCNGVNVTRTPCQFGSFRSDGLAYTDSTSGGSPGFYQPISTGASIQSGSAAFVLNGSHAGDITFPVAFGGIPAVLVCNGDNTAGPGLSVSLSFPSSFSGFTVFIPGGTIGQTYRVNWIAQGPPA